MTARNSTLGLPPRPPVVEDFFFGSSSSASPKLSSPDLISSKKETAASSTASNDSRGNFLERSSSTRCRGKAEISGSQLATSHPRRWSLSCALLQTVIFRNRSPQTQPHNSSARTPHQPILLLLQLLLLLLLTAAAAGNAAERLSCFAALTRRLSSRRAQCSDDCRWKSPDVRRRRPRILVATAVKPSTHPSAHASCHS